MSEELLTVPAVPVNFEVPTGDYNSFINDLRAKLADHPNPEEVSGHPVLPKQRVPQAPARWMHCNLSAGDHKKPVTATLAVRDDNVYLIGFKAQSGKWYEFGFEGKTVPMIAGSTLLECDVDYRSLVGGATSKEVKANLVKMKLGKSFADEGVHRLSGYAPPAKGGAPDATTKLDLARLIVMVCESARMISISGTTSNGWAQGSSINDRQVDYLWNWGLMSQALLGWKKYEDKYKWPPALTKIGVRNATDALAVVQLLLNKPAPPPKQQQLLLQAEDSEEDEALGKPLVEVFAVRADFPIVGTVAVFDGRRGQFIYKHDHHLPPIHQGEVVLSGPYRAVSAYGNCTIKVDIDTTEETSPTGEFNNAGGTLQCWDCYGDNDGDDNAAYDTPLTRTISTARGPVEVTYAVLSNAVEATVQVKLLPAGAGALVHGEVTARSKAFDLASMLFRRDSGDKVAVASDGSTVPLARSVVAVPLGSPLVVEVIFRTAAGDSGHLQESNVQGELEFYPQLSGEEVNNLAIDDHRAVEVKVTWSDI